MTKIKTSEINGLRELLLEEQMDICPLCSLIITKDKAVLDHNHKTGHIRAVLHRGCNTMLGQIENNLKRNGISNPLEFLIGCSHWIQNEPDTGLIHPTHLTPEEKQIRVKTRAKKAYQKRKEFKSQNTGK